MRRIWFLSLRQSKAVFSSFLVAALLTPFLPSSAHASRNGIEEPTNAFTVGITFKFGLEEQLCSGVMLNPTLVVTAAHCVISPTGEVGTNYYFTVPGVALDAAIDPRIIQPRVIKVFTDPAFSPLDSNNLNDIAFLLLDKPLQSKIYLKFASKAELYALTESSTVAGYGYGRVFETDQPYSIYPRKYELMWRALDTSTIWSNTFAISSESASPCRGDSGGPIVATLPDGKELLIGVLSGAQNVKGGCASQDKDGKFYIRLTAGFPFLPLISSLYSPTAIPQPTKKVTIRCKKGSITKKVTAVKPVCPKGYKSVK